MVIFSYTGSPEVKISQKVLGGGLLFLTHTVDARMPALWLRLLAAV